MERTTITPPLPGAVGVTHLRVYDTPAPDGLVGGSPHVHFACTEAYLVLAGRGAVQTLSAAGFAETPLEPGGMVWFTPGLIHRLINGDGRLEILVLMQNAGLPEAGDFALTFPAATLADERAYWEAASLASRTRVYASNAEAARRRRDQAVEGFCELRSAFERDGAAALDAFYAAALRLLQPRLDAWRTRWQDGPLAAARATGEQIAALGHGDTGHLHGGRLYELPAPDSQRALGMCGTLGLYLPEGSA
ncbi:MAG TPA: cupin domain-containing protein [Roseiflexaceae bacterium]|nr:cupin domain-containing protein [Roseiflexaceae bacterium]